jgi:hypothetical protein
MPQLKLSDRIRAYPVYEDTTRFGSAVTNRCDLSIRNACADIAAYRKAHGLSAVVAHTRELLSTAISGGLAELYDRPGVLHQDWLYPDPNAVQPIALALENEIGQAIAHISLPPGLIPDLAAYLGEWSRGCVAPMQPSALNLWKALAEIGALTDVLPEMSSISPTPGHATFVGHATVRIQSATARILVDPFLLPKSNCYPVSYQPLDLAALGYPDAVFITTLRVYFDWVQRLRSTFRKWNESLSLRLIWLIDSGNLGFVRSKHCPGLKKLQSTIYV